jgi:hypothetical protein
MKATHEPYWNRQAQERKPSPDPDASSWLARCLEKLGHDVI